MQETLIEYLKRQWPEAESIDIEGFAVIAGGYSRETYRFDAHVHREGQRHHYPMILRKNPPPAAAILETSREAEHNLLRRLAQHTTIPVSEAYFCEMQRDTFGEAAMIIERVQGTGETNRLFHGGPDADQAEAVATHLCEILAELHCTDPALLNPDHSLDDPRGLGIDASTWESYLHGMTDYYIAEYQNFAFDALPTFRDAYLHLRRNTPRPLPLRVVHGDFNPGNFLYKDGKVTALIDWENAHLGDPREDLGWLSLMDVLSNTSVMGSVKKEGGFLQYYNKLTGFDVTPEEVAYFSLYSGANIGVPVVSAVKRRVQREHMELMHLYLVQPVLVSELTFAQILGYPMPAAGGQS